VSSALERRRIREGRGTNANHDLFDAFYGIPLAELLAYPRTWNRGQGTGIMTQYGIGMTFCNIELEVLQKAISHYLNLCKQEIKKGKDVPFFAHSTTLKRIRAELRKEAKGPLTVSWGELETSALEAALKSYVDVGEREIATDMNKPFLAEMELAKMICEAMRIEFWRAVFVDELRQEGRKRRPTMRD
jgi:hypothetical protein